MDVKRILAAVVVLLTLAATACSSTEPANEIKLGVVDIGKPHWKVFTDLAKEKGFAVKLVSFSDYNAPNPALADSSIDLNQFQHVRYLAAYNTKNTVRLTPVGATQIYPLQLYSKKYRSIDALPAGASVGLSDNPANQIRPLLSLKAAGLVTFRDGAGTWKSTLADVDRERSKVKLVTLDPTQIGPALDSLDAGFVDDTFATKLGLTTKDSIYTDDPNRPDLAQYVNIFAARENDPRIADYTRLAAIYHDDRVHRAVVADAGEAAVFRTESPEQLRATLTQTEEALKAPK
ncbi:ABC transporter substrate-binding protein [Tsukamurella sp. TY48]|nr:ABC transporter substrate-binding protein [Tsukamurella sp. TY48]